MEYVVTCVKHLFANHVVLQFSVLNTVDDQRLRDVRYTHTLTHTHIWQTHLCLHLTALPLYCTTLPPAILPSLYLLFLFFLLRLLRWFPLKYFSLCCSHCTLINLIYLRLYYMFKTYIILQYLPPPYPSPTLLHHLERNGTARYNVIVEQSGCGDLGPWDLSSRVSHQRSNR